VRDQQAPAHQDRHDRSAPVIPGRGVAWAAHDQAGRGAGGGGGRGQRPRAGARNVRAAGGAATVPALGRGGPPAAARAGPAAEAARAHGPAGSFQVGRVRGGEGLLC